MMMLRFKEYKGWKGVGFEPHMMYDPKTGKGYKALKPADHERMKKLGYTHDKPKDVDEEMTSTGSVVGTGDDNQTVVMRKKYDKKNKRKDQLDVLKRFIDKSK